MVGNLRISLLFCVLIVVEAFYFMVGGSAVIYFSPEFVVIAVAFAGLMAGRKYGLVLGAMSGFLEDLCFIEPEGIFGLRAISYIWIGFLFGSFAYHKAQLDHPITSSIAALCALAANFAMLAILRFIFQSKIEMISLSFGNSVSLFLHVLVVAPILFRLMVMVLQQERYV